MGGQIVKYGIRDTLRDTDKGYLFIDIFLVVMELRDTFLNGFNIKFKRHISSIVFV